MKIVKVVEERLTFTEIEYIPQPKENEILIKVQFCGLSPELDEQVIQGNFKNFTSKQPIIGYEVSKSLLI